MRYLKLASAKKPNTDFIELNDLEGFLCTSFQPIGISRRLEFLQIKNRQFEVGNNLNFKKYTLIIEILTKYSEYEAKHREFISFLDRNKKDGFRLYFRPYEGMDLRYCLCSIESSQRTEKMQPITLTLVQNSLWFGQENKSTTAHFVEEESNLFAFIDDNGYYSTSFSLDEQIPNYYCVAFYSNIETQASIINKGYNEVPLIIRIYGRCVNPTVSLFKKNENNPIRQLQVFAIVDNDYYVEVNANIEGNGVWYVNNQTKEKVSFDGLLNNELGSPYFYIDNGEYYIKVMDDANNTCICDVFWQEEYSE